MIPTIYLELKEALSSRCDEREARAIAFLVLEEGFGVSRLDVYADKVRHFSEEEQQRLQIILQRLCHGEPVQYVLGRARFCGMDLKVSPATLIPRPETEELVALAADFAGRIADDGRPLRVVDGGTGSGCIAIALAAALPTAHVEGWDISEAALAVARDNAAEQGWTSTPLLSTPKPPPRCWSSPTASWPKTA